ncbi:TIGR03826 family flagellar region protein [Lederbergia citrea]|uniref:TIGR03826 family flagellar region protein n=1 Tax=Lederbergia citrea TaxID=2833581 RepID=UPI001BC9124D|nr:TIGR03826 family flagellar region protein [Lederbergia citrea]MBS4204946.1 hypothetical protein [Lederbergia citrea]
MDLLNCPNCGDIYVKHAIRDICDKCYREEEADYEKVYRFLRVRENRAATIERVAEVTGVKEELLYKWVRSGRLHTAQFPNLGYPCDKCGKIIRKGKLCEGCVTGMIGELETFEMERNRQEALHKAVYLSRDKRK